MGLLGYIKSAASSAKLVMPIAAIAMAVIKHGLVICMNLYGLYIQHCVFHGIFVPIMSLPVHSF